MNKSPEDPPNKKRSLLDLTNLEGGGKTAVETRPEDDLALRIQNRQDWVHTALALGGFISLVAVLLILLISVIFNKLDINNLEKASVAIVTPLTGIVGTIVGFYFAERRR